MSAAQSLRPDEPRVVPAASPASDGLIVRLLSDPPGVVEAPARPTPVVVIHVGRSVHIACDRGGKRHRGLSVHGDVDIVPAGVPSRWELRETDTALIVRMGSDFLHGAAEQCGIEPSRVEVVNRFQIRDRQIEHIGWALKAEMEAGFPNGRLYLDCLGMALSVHLLKNHSPHSQPGRNERGGMPGHRLKRVLAYIEENLSGNLSLEEVAAVAGLSVSHSKAAFRNSMGVPIHQYVIQRRVERAKTLLGERNLSIAEVALETGFSHQSHLAYHMRRVLGISPSAIRASAHGV